MSTDAPFTPRHPSSSPTAAGLHTLRQVAESGLLRCAVPERLGGSGGSLADLARGAEELARASAAAGWVLWAQRMAIEALVQSPNASLRDHWLPDLFTGERAGTLPMPITTAPLVATDTGRGWLLHGTFSGVPNLQWMGCSVAAPVQLGDGESSWVLLRSEEDGLAVEHAAEGGFPAGARVASLRLSKVFFREDEWLGNADLPQRLQPVEAALSRALSIATDASRPAS